MHNDEHVKLMADPSSGGAGLDSSNLDFFQSSLRIEALIGGWVDFEFKGGLIISIWGP